MKTEKIVISFIAIIVGILVAGLIFYVYQSTKTVPGKSLKTISVKPPSPTPPKSIFLGLETPANETVTDKKTISVTGKTTTDATIVILTPVNEEIVSPAQNGNFSATVTIDDGQNIIEVTAIAPNGEETTITRTITYSTESF